MGEMATGIALVCGLAAALAWAALGVASLLRWQRHPQAWADDLKHPVRHTLVATLPVATLLLATVGVRPWARTRSCRAVVAGLAGAVRRHAVGAGPLVAAGNKAAWPGRASRRPC
jgi:hypothetical protein